MFSLSIFSNFEVHAAHLGVLLMSRYTPKNDPTEIAVIDDRNVDSQRKMEESPGGFPIFQEKIEKIAIALDPKRCRPWQFHNRDMAWLTIERCNDLISSIQKHGQHQPALVRPLLQDPNFEYEIIYGVRRWFACSTIPNQKLWAYVAELDDKTCTILMHTENSNSKDITEFERACSFAQQLQSKIFKNQTEMAEALGISQGNISKMISASEIFDYDWVQKLFNNKLDIPIKYAYLLSVYLKKADLLALIMNEADSILNEKEITGTMPSASKTLKRLINIVKSNPVDPLEAIVLTRNNKPIVSCKRDKFGKVHIVIEQDAKRFSPTEIRDACFAAINQFVFTNYSPENNL